MKTPMKVNRTMRGDTLVSALVLGCVLLIILVSYLALLMSQKNQVTHSQTWNGSLTLAEAGVEEALAQLNSQQVFGGFASFTNLNATNPPPTDFSNNGWGATGSGAGAGFGPMSRTLGLGTYGVKIYTNFASPVVYSTGYVAVPITGDTLYRVVEITTGYERLLNVGVGARDGITGNGNFTISDSYNSLQGPYNAATAGTNGDVASITGTVNLGNDNISGDLYLGPTANFTSSSNNIDGTVHTDYNIQYPSVTMPAGASSWPLAVPVSTTITNIKSNGSLSVNTVLAYNFTSTGNYQITSSTTYPIIIQPGVTVALNVDASGTFNASGLQILGGTNNSGTAIFYVNGPTSFATSGNTAITASRPENLWIFGLPTLQTISFSGNAAFVGIIYAPDSDITLSGSGNNTTDVMGAVVGNSVTFNGHFHVHYDESLSNVGPVLGYVATSWQELN